MKWTIAALALVMSSGAFAQAMYITPDGDVGVGTDAPLAPFEVTRADGTAKVLVTDTGDVLGPKTLFEILNYGNPEFRLTNTYNNNSWVFSAGLRFVVKNNAGDWVMRITDTGDMEITGALSELSDVNAKQAIVPVDPRDILQKVSALPISQWQYKDVPGVNHVGPMAQDFRAAFGLGASDTGLSTMDTSGVALAAIQALSAENAELKSRLEALEQQQVQMQAVMVRMLEQQSESRPVRASLN